MLECVARARLYLRVTGREKRLKRTGIIVVISRFGCFAHIPDHYQHVGIGFFKHFSDVELWEVMRLASWHKYSRDATLIQEGDIGSSFFILISGQVKVVKQDRLLNLLKVGECFGEMAYLGKHKFQRSASVISISDIALVEIRAETLGKASELCRHHFHGAFLELLVDRLSMANLRLSQLLADRNVSVF